MPKCQGYGLTNTANRKLLNNRYGEKHQQSQMCTRNGENAFMPSAVLELEARLLGVLPTSTSLT